MSNFTYVYEDPTTGQPVRYTSPRYLRDDEKAAIARERWGQDAKLLDQPPSPLTKFQERVGPAIAPRGTGPVPPHYGPEPENVGGESLGLLASLPIGMGAARLAGKVGASTVPRLSRLLGGATGGAAGGAAHPLVAGRFEDIPSEAATGATLGTLGGLLGVGKGAVARHSPGATRRVGEEMAGQMEQVGGQQVPVLKGLKTAESLRDWAKSQGGQEGLNQMYGDVREAVNQAIAANQPTRTGWKAALAQKVGGTGQLTIPALGPKAKTFDSALEEIKTLGRAFEQPATGAGVQEKRQAWMEAWDQMYGELSRLGVPPEVQQQLTAVRGQYAKALAYRMLLEDAFNQRRMVPGIMQQTLDENQRVIQRLMGWSKGPKDFDALTDTLLRGKRGAPHPLTGERPSAVGETDIKGAGPLSILRGYLIGTEQGPKFRSGAAVPHGALFNRFVAAPGRLPLEAKPQTYDVMALLSQLGRARATAETPAAE